MQERFRFKLFVVSSYTDGNLYISCRPAEAYICSQKKYAIWSFRQILYIRSRGEPAGQVLYI